ncbi:MAG TPA: sugar phosphate isomerase/epimerase [Ktedonobacteraceae bacterium]|nr:sugar phosphate isomerase/epimerase [Ktedonobacteraceae bacterium]
MRVGLAVYGTTYGMGIDPASNRPTITPKQLLDKVNDNGLEGIELPASMMLGVDTTLVANYAQERGLFITLETEGYNPAKLAADIDLSVQLGAKTMRTIVGGAKLGGDRRPLAGRWQLFLQEILGDLQKATIFAERAGVNLTVENHQDLTSEELLWLCKSIDSQHFGITLDTGSTLATAEEPVEFARSVAPYVKNVHLKDYELFMYEEGYRLVRCPLGEGVVDFPALLEILSEMCPEVTMSIEIGALEARNVRVFAEDYWHDYPPRTAAQFAHVLRFVLDSAKTTGDWRSPFERNEPVESIIAYEDQQLSTSIAYILHLLAQTSKS